MVETSDFIIHEPRPLPVIILADISGSMAQDNKIDSLNIAIREMIGSFASESDSRTSINTCVITFGNDVCKIHIPFMPASSVKWSDMEADGNTPMGKAFSKTHELIEDKSVISSRAYSPTIVLVSDGQPNDEWKDPLDKLLSSKRAVKAQRLAMAIGDDADKNMLKLFVNDSEVPVVEASNARTIKKFFRWVTMSVTSRKRSRTPEITEKMLEFDSIPEEEGDYIF